MAKEWKNKILYYIHDRSWMTRVTTSLAVINGLAFLIVGLMVNGGAKEMTKLADTITPQIIHDTITIVEERKPEYLIEHGYLEPLEDFEYNGKQVLASRLGYRITDHFVHGFFGKIFDNPSAVFTEAIRKPETQDQETYADGIDNIVEAQQRVALQYLEDGSIEDA